MKRENIARSLGKIDNKYIEEALTQPEEAGNGSRTAQGRRTVTRFAAAVCCAAAAVALMIVLPGVVGRFRSSSDPAGLSTQSQYGDSVYPLIELNDYPQSVSLGSVQNVKRVGFTNRDVTVEGLNIELEISTEDTLDGLSADMLAGYADLMPTLHMWRGENLCVINNSELEPGEVLCVRAMSLEYGGVSGYQLTQKLKTTCGEYGLLAEQPKNFGIWYVGVEMSDGSLYFVRYIVPSSYTSDRSALAQWETDKRNNYEEVLLSDYTQSVPAASEEAVGGFGLSNGDVVIECLAISQEGLDVSNAAPRVMRLYDDSVPVIFCPSECRLGIINNTPGNAEITTVIRRLSGSGGSYSDSSPVSRGNSVTGEYIGMSSAARMRAGVWYVCLWADDGYCYAVKVVVPSMSREEIIAAVNLELFEDEYPETPSAGDADSVTGLGLAVGSTVVEGCRVSADGVIAPSGGLMNGWYRSSVGSPDADVPTLHYPAGLEAEIINNTGAGIKSITTTFGVTGVYGRGTETVNGVQEHTVSVNYGHCDISSPVTDGELPDIGIARGEGGMWYCVIETDDGNCYIFRLILPYS